MGSSKRIAKWDNLKFFFILCVVAGHFLKRFDSLPMAKSIVFFIYTFHMPAFIFISGLFAKKTVDEKRYDKIFSFLIMFVITKWGALLAKFLCGQKPGIKYFEINDVSWYAFAIFVFCLVTIFLKKFSPVYVMVGTIVFACVSGYASDIGTFLSLSRIVVFYPIFLLGYYLKPEDIMKVTGKIYMKVIGAVIIVITAIISVVKIDDIYWLITLFRGKVPYESLKYYSLYGGMLRFAWYIAAMLIVFSWVALMPSVHSVITTWGGRTMQVYVLHNIFVNLFFSMFNGKELVKQIWPEHYIVLVLLLSLVITCVLSVKPIKIVMDKIIYPKLRET